MVVFELDDVGDGMAYIPFEGDQPVHLIVSPVDEDAQGYWYDWTDAVDFNYLWSARVVSESDVGTVVDSDGPQTVPLGEFSMSDSPKGCSCASASQPFKAWFYAFGLGFVFLSRRRQR